MKLRAAWGVFTLGRQAETQRGREAERLKRPRRRGAEGAAAEAEARGRELGRGTRRIVTVVRMTWASNLSDILFGDLGRSGDILSELSLPNNAGLQSLRHFVGGDGEVW